MCTTHHHILSIPTYSEENIITSLDNLHSGTTQESAIPETVFPDTKATSEYYTSVYFISRMKQKW